MPIYEYEHDACAAESCSARFQLLQPIGAAARTACPRCGQPCHRVISAFAVTGSDRDLLGDANLKRHGFSRFESSGDGGLTRTGGAGVEDLGTR